MWEVGKREERRVENERFGVTGVVSGGPLKFELESNQHCKREREKERPGRGQPSEARPRPPAFLSLEDEVKETN